MLSAIEFTTYCSKITNRDNFVVYMYVLCIFFDGYPFKINFGSKKLSAKDGVLCEEKSFEKFSRFSPKMLQIYHKILTKLVLRTAEKYHKFTTDLP
jgi:hypothetical protein